MVRVTQKRQRDSISKLNGEKEHKVTPTIKAKTKLEGKKKHLQK